MNNCKIYIISDTHFNHEKITDFCDRPQDYEKRLFKSMSRLTASDTLVHLGDVCIGNDKYVHRKYIQPLECKKILVKGNHDHKSHHWYMNNGWDFSCDSFDMVYMNMRIAFSHEPLAWNGLWELNIHGHFHDLMHRDYDNKAIEDLYLLYSPELYQENFTAVNLKNFIEKKLKSLRRHKC